jgi:hypothetical protein
MMKKIFLIPILVVVGAGALFAYRMQVANNSNIIPNTPNTIACTLEAKLCPDGSYVGRTGPRCEFAECPAAPVPTPISKKSGISGTVTLSPTCPVERIPPDPGCAPRGYATSINILKSGSSAIIKIIQSNDSGAFSVDLASGSYILQAQGGKVLPRCGDISVVVKSNQYTKTEISCDTGIR